MPSLALIIASARAANAGDWEHAPYSLCRRRRIIIDIVVEVVAAAVVAVVAFVATSASPSSSPPRPWRLSWPSHRRQLVVAMLVATATVAAASVAAVVASSVASSHRLAALQSSPQSRYCRRRPSSIVHCCGNEREREIKD